MYSVADWLGGIFWFCDVFFFNIDYKVGDGGKSWLQKSYDRAVKQAKEQGVPVEDIISKRYGVRIFLNFC